MYKPNTEDSNSGKLDNELNAKLSMEKIIVTALVYLKRLVLVAYNTRKQLVCFDNLRQRFEKGQRRLSNRVIKQ